MRRKLRKMVAMVGISSATLFQVIAGPGGCDYGTSGYNDLVDPYYGYGVLGDILYDIDNDPFQNGDLLYG